MSDINPRRLWWLRGAIVAHPGRTSFYLTHHRQPAPEGRPVSQGCRDRPQPNCAGDTATPLKIRSHRARPVGSENPIAGLVMPIFRACLWQLTQEAVPTISTPDCIRFRRVIDYET